jgi:PAS domain S-box-containing protein
MFMNTEKNRSDASPLPTAHCHLSSDALKKNRRLLIIDDNQAIHADFKKILAGTGNELAELALAEAELFGAGEARVEAEAFELTSAFQGQEGLAAVKKAREDGRPFALAFVDVRMPPGWDGIETTSRIWEIDPDLQIVICTAYSDYSWDQMTKRLGASDRLVILKKPFDTIEVLQLANALTEKWRLAQQARERVEDLERMVTQRTQELRAANEALLQDIAERKRARAALAESEASLRESQRVGRVGSYTLDIPTGRWTSSDILNEIFGIELDYERNIPGWSALIHPDDRKSTVDYLASVFSNKSRFERDYRIVRHRDSEVRWVLGVGELTLDEAGNPIKMIGVIQDITARKVAERRTTAFASLGQRLSAAKAEQEAGKIITSIADELLGWDASSFSLYSSGDDKLNPVLSFTMIDGQRVETDPSQDRSAPTSFIRRVIDQGGQLIVKSAAENADAQFGEIDPAISMLAVPVRDGTRVLGILSIRRHSGNAYDQQDLATLQSLADHCGSALTRIQAETARARLENQFRQAQKMDAVGQLAGGVAHDFNNIMAAVLMHLGLLQADESIAGQIKSSLRELEREVQRGARLTRQLLMFSRRQVMQMALLDLNQVVVDMLKMLERLLGENILVQFTRCDLPAMVSADAGMMEQVIMNLSVNARDAMPKGGQLSISIDTVAMGPDASKLNPESRSGAFICLSVTDTGCGIDEETRQHIFEPFFTTKELGKGTGLGLPTVHGIAKQHQGWIEVESQVGRGSTFKVFLPALPEVPLTKPQAAPEQVRGGTETILLVEDEFSVRRVAAKMLTRHGYKVIEAENGRDALQKWDEHNGQFDLLFSDVIMPEGMTGLELAERLKKTNSNLKILVSSGYSPELAGKDTGFFKRNNSYFLQKPYASRILIETVRKCLDDPQQPAEMI